MFAPEIDITAFFTEEAAPRDYSASAAELGHDAGALRRELERALEEKDAAISMALELARSLEKTRKPRMLEGWTENGREALTGLYSPWRPGWVATRPRFYRKRGAAVFAVALLDTAGKTGDIVGVFGNRAAAENHAGHQPNRAHYRPAVLPWGELEARRARGWIFYT